MAQKLFSSFNGGSFYFFRLKILSLNSYKNAKQKKIVGFDLTQGKALNSFFLLILYFSVSLYIVLRPSAACNNLLLKMSLTKMKNKLLQLGAYHKPISFLNFQHFIFPTLVIGPYFFLDTVSKENNNGFVCAE